MPTTVRKPSLTIDPNAEASGDGAGGVAMQAHTPVTSSGSNQGQANAIANAQAAERARRASFDYPHPPQLQAQRMYPNHPLLAGTPSPLAWTTPGPDGLIRSPVNTFNNGMLGTPVNSAGFHPGLASPVQWSGVDPVAGSSAMTRNESSYTSSSYNEFGIKKRACDQCNHSKVRCDFGHPCSELIAFLTAWASADPIQHDVLIETCIAHTTNRQRVEHSRSRACTLLTRFRFPQYPISHRPHTWSEARSISTCIKCNNLRVKCLSR